MYSQSMSEEKLNAVIYNWNDKISVVLPEGKQQGKTASKVVQGKPKSKSVTVLYVLSDTIKEHCCFSLNWVIRLSGLQKMVIINKNIKNSG